MFRHDTVQVQTSAWRFVELDGIAGGAFRVHIRASQARGSKKAADAARVGN